MQPFIAETASYINSCACAGNISSLFNYLDEAFEFYDHSHLCELEYTEVGLLEIKERMKTERSNSQRRMNIN